METREFEVNYQHILKDELLKRICMEANADGLAGRQIEHIETSAEWGEGLKVKFFFKKPILSGFWGV